MKTKVLSLFTVLLITFSFSGNKVDGRSGTGPDSNCTSIEQCVSKDCESYSYESSGMMTVFAGWKNICLLTEQKMKVGSSVTKAVKVEENVVIAPEKFRVPAGYAIK